MENRVFTLFFILKGPIYFLGEMHIFTCFFSKSIPMTCRVIVVAFADKPLAVERNFCLLSAWVNMWPSGRTSCWNKKWNGNKGVWYFLSRISVVEEILFFLIWNFWRLFSLDFPPSWCFFFRSELLHLNYGHVHLAISNRSSRKTARSYLQNVPRIKPHPACHEFGCGFWVTESC